MEYKKCQLSHFHIRSTLLSSPSICQVFEEKPAINLVSAMEIVFTIRATNKYALPLLKISFVITGEGGDWGYILQLTKNRQQQAVSKKNRLSRSNNISPSASSTKCLCLMTKRYNRQVWLSSMGMSIFSIVSVF